MMPTCQKETEIFIVEGTLSYANCAVRRHNFAVLRNSVNSPATYITIYGPVRSEYSSYRVLNIIIVKGKLSTFYRLLGKIRENFAMLQVIMPDDTYFVITDRKQITPTELVGSLGSILNLWAGITVLFIIEVIEVKLWQIY